MIRFWLGLALLGGSWLFGAEVLPRAGLCHLLDIDYRRLAAALGRASAPCRHGRVVHRDFHAHSVAVLAPGPYRGDSHSADRGLLLHLAPFPVRWPRLMASGAFAAGMVLLCQSLGMLVYETGTARSHDAPPPINKLLQPITSAPRYRRRGRRQHAHHELDAQNSSAGGDMGADF